MTVSTPSDDLPKGAAVDLIKALGGGWDASTLPSGDALRSITRADPSLGR
jgi:hypothetical protein